MGLPRVPRGFSPNPEVRFGVHRSHLDGLFRIKSNGRAGKSPDVSPSSRFREEGKVSIELLICF
jgi:hypothetical protein